MRVASSTTPARVLVAAVGFVLLAVGLTGCAGGAGSGGCTPEASAGDASNTVTATGPLGVAPAVRFPTPTHVSGVQASRIRTGSGTGIIRTQEIVADITILNATTGATVTKTKYAGLGQAAAFVPDKVALPGIAKGLVCARVGDRIAMVMGPKDGYPAAQRPTTVQASDSLVVVADVLKAYLPRADGTPQVMAGGLPSVVLAPNGQPGITIPAGQKPPTKLEVANLRTGSGPVVKRGETAIVHYTGVLWDDGSLFDSSWKNGAPVALPLKDTAIVKGLVTALAGQRVGSQVLAVLPPSEGYGAQGQGSIPGGATLVFVIDVLGKS